MQPLVTALLPTIARPIVARRALACMLSQTWKNIEYLILDDQDRPSFSDDPGLSNLTYCRVDEPYLGPKLNLASRIARGKYLVHFHDDDYSSPFRIADQVTRLEESDKAVTNYRNLQFTDGQRIWKNTNWIGGFGMSLCHRRDWSLKHSFPLHSSEDWDFVTEAIREKQFVAGDAGDFMMVTLSASSNIGQGWIELS